MRRDGRNERCVSGLRSDQDGNQLPSMVWVDREDLPCVRDLIEPDTILSTLSRLPLAKLCSVATSARLPRMHRQPLVRCVRTNTRREELAPSDRIGEGFCDAGCGMLGVAKGSKGKSRWSCSTAELESSGLAPIQALTRRYTEESASSSRSFAPRIIELTCFVLGVARPGRDCLEESQQRCVDLLSRRGSLSLLETLFL